MLKRVAFARAALLPSNGNECHREPHEVICSRVSHETERWHSDPGGILLGGTEASVWMWSWSVVREIGTRRNPIS